MSRSGPIALFRMPRRERPCERPASGFVDHAWLRDDWHTPCPAAPPLAVRLDWPRVRIGLCQQALHRFVTPAAAREMGAFFADCDVAIASPDFDDEEACGRLLGALGARHNVLIDSIGPVRRKLGLPTRPLIASMPTAPPGTLQLEEGQRVTLNVA